MRSETNKIKVGSDHLSQTDIILVNPGNKQQAYGSLGETLAGIEPPLLIALLAGFLREQGFSVTIIDAEAEGLGASAVVDRIARSVPLVVGIGVIGANPSASSTPKMVAVRPILRLIRERDLPCKTFLFGIHPAALPERTLREESVDFVVRGEAFYPAAILLRAMRSGEKDFSIPGLWFFKEDRVVDNGWATAVQDLDSLPSAAWDLLPMDRYRAHNWHCFDDLDHRSPYAVIYTSLGCPFHCHYCNIHALYGEQAGFRLRSPDRVVADIDHLYQTYQVRHIKILDELFVINKDRVLAFCDLLIQRDYDLNMWAYARIDTVSEDVLKKIKAAGVNWLAFGIEAGSQAVRQGVAKGRFDQKAVHEAIALAHKAGIFVIGNFMFGLPDDDLTTMRETLDLAQGLDCEYVNFYTTMAYPGSPLYEEALQKGLDLPATWQGYAQFSAEALPLPTRHLSAAQVLQFRDAAFHSYYSDAGYQARIRKTFGPEAVTHIRQMLRHKLHRNILSENPLTI